MNVISTLNGMFNLCSFVLENSLRMALQCQNMQEFDTHHELYSIICVLLYCIQCIYWLIY